MKNSNPTETESAGSPWKRYATWYALVCSGIVLGIALNVAVNPYGEFPYRGLQDYGRKSWGPHEKLGSYQNITYEPTGLVLGSSRSLHALPQDLNAMFGGEWYNFAIPGAGTPADADAIFRYVLETNPRLQAVWYGLDEWMVTANPEIERPDMKSNPVLKRYYSSPRTGVDYATLAVQSFSDYYVLDSAKLLKNWMTGTRPPTTAYGPDGYPAPGGGDLIADPDPDIVAASRERIRGFHDRLEPAAPSRLADLSMLAEAAEKSHVQFHIFLTPIHPVALSDAAGGPRDKLVTEILAFLPALCSEYVRVYDFTRIETFGGDGHDFVNDYAHIGSEGHAKMMAAAAAGPGRIC